MPTSSSGRRPVGDGVPGRIDGRYLSTEVAGGFTGRVVGVFCSEGHLDLRSFSYTGADDL
jgi:xylan 1,4-beta-xylosidase